VNIHIPADFTLSELRAFIEGEAQEAPEGYYTASEWADHFCINIELMRKLLREAKEKGLLQMTKVPRQSIDEKGYMVPVYALRGKDDISDSHKTIQTEE
jgi:hypothetical protein